MRITEGSTWMRAPADMKECDAANNVNGLMRKGGCSDLGLYSDGKIDKRYAGQPQCSSSFKRS